MEETKKVSAAEFFCDNEGNKSMIRLMSFLVFLLLVVIDFLVLKTGYYADHAFDKWFVIFMVAMNLVFLIAVFYPKYLQKIIELGASKLKDFKDSLTPVKPDDVKKLDN